VRSCTHCGFDKQHYSIRMRTNKGFGGSHSCHDEWDGAPYFNSVPPAPFIERNRSSLERIVNENYAGQSVDIEEPVDRHLIRL